MILLLVATPLAWAQDAPASSSSRPGPAPASESGSATATSAGALSLSAPMSLDEILAAARAHNASLPVAAADVDASRARSRAAGAQRFAALSLEGDGVYAPRGAYDPAATNLGEERLQAVLRQPLYRGGAIVADIEAARAAYGVAQARFRISQRDLELDVRTRVDALAAARDETSVRDAGLARLDAYATFLAARRAAGQPVGLDYERARVRVAAAEAARDEARQREYEARFALNDRMGREPGAPLTLAALPAPSRRRQDTTPAAPELDEAAAAIDIARAGLRLARAERRPHLDLTADAGFWGTGEDAPPWAGPRLRRDEGASAGIALTWDLLDAGAARARVAAAKADLARAERARVVAERNAALMLALAHRRIDDLGARLATAEAAVTTAENAALDAESRYRGGAGSAVDVLDAEADAMDAAVRRILILQGLRDAQAQALRWGSP